MYNLFDDHPSIPLGLEYGPNQYTHNDHYNDIIANENFMSNIDRGYMQHFDSVLGASSMIAPIVPNAQPVN